MKEADASLNADDKRDTAANNFESALRERLDALPNAGARRTFASLTRELRRLPADRARAALEVSASLAPLGFRLSLDFLRVAPAAAQILAPEELKQWGEMGRRLALDGGQSAEFFQHGVAHLSTYTPAARRLLFELCARQMRLSLSIARETLEQAGALAASVGASAHIVTIYEVALEISRRSAKHSADFLTVTPKAIAAVRTLRDFETNDADIITEAIALAHRFATRAGGVAAEVWAVLPATLDGLTIAHAREMFRLAEQVLDRGGAAALASLSAAAACLRRTPQAFDAWADLLLHVGDAGTTNLVQCARLTPEFFRYPLDPSDHTRNAELTRRVFAVAREVATVDVDAALACFRSAPQALRGSTTIEAFERWAREGLTLTGADDTRARRSYYALETSRSHERLLQDRTGLRLEDVAQTLRLYVEALTDREVDVRPFGSTVNAPAAGEARIEDGRTIHLPPVVDEFEEDELNFRLYKVLAAHGAGQIEFETHARGTSPLRAAYTALAELYAEDSINALDAFSLSGYIEDVTKGEQAFSIEEERRIAIEKRKRVPKDADFRSVLALFPETTLARRLFGTLENARIDRRLRHTYKGLRRDLDFVRERLRARRPRVIELPVSTVAFELLFQITLCGGATDDARQFYSQIVSELETVVADYLSSPEATVADTLMATSRTYALFQSISPQRPNTEDDNNLDGIEDATDAPGETSHDSAEDTEAQIEQQNRETTDRTNTRDDARELFNQWAQSAAASDALDDLLGGQEQRAYTQAPEQALAPGETAHFYDEWDRELSDTRVAWCRVIERAGKIGDRSFVEIARSRHRGVISSIRHQFQLMRPEGLRRVRRQLDGDDYDLDAVVEHVADRRTAHRTRADSNPSERLYTARLRRERDVAVAFLLDQSSSTARTIGRHPLQPYTHPGRRIIEIEKEGLVLMSEALEAVGDPFAIYGFTSEGRRNVRFYVVKDFDDKLDERVERRIGGINYEHNTRLGAAVRHAAARLSRQAATTRLLIVLSDGRPYDHDYGDGLYAREDTREALKDARTDGITPFCITIDRDSEQELRTLYGEVGYTIIDDVMNLPERLPAIYRRLTT